MKFYDGFAEELDKIAKALATRRQMLAAKRAGKEYERRTGMPQVGPSHQVPVPTRGGGITYADIDKVKRVPKDRTGSTGFELIEKAASGAFLNEKEGGNTRGSPRD